MKPLKIFEWGGIVKFSSVKELESGKYIRSSLLQHCTEQGKKSHIKTVEWFDEKVDPLQKDLEIEFSGTVRENIYKNKDDKFISTGLEVNMEEYTIMEVFN